MEHITKALIDSALPKTKTGYDRYLWIQERISLRNTSAAKEFRKAFNSFYRITPFRDEGWQRVFYDLLEKSKLTGGADFGNVLDELHQRTGRWEASFASKLVHSIHPDRPVIAKHVLRNLGLPQVAEMKKNKANLVWLYNAASQGIKRLLQSKTGEYLVEKFIESYPGTKITKTKMVDFVLWQIRN